jgi:hypothetical protein
VIGGVVRVVWDVVPAAQEIDAQPGHDGGQPGRQVADAADLRPVEADPRLLQDVVDVGVRTEDAERDRA